MSNASPADSAGVRYPPPLIPAAYFLASWLLGRAVDARFSNTNSNTYAFRLLAPGVAVCIAAIVLAAWAMISFRRARTSILPHHPATTIVETGPFRFTRNPMYIALTGAYAGAALVVNNWMPLLFLPAAIASIYYLVIRREEAYLTRAFGDSYRDYQRRVRRWF